MRNKVLKKCLMMTLCLTLVGQAAVPAWAEGPADAFVSESVADSDGTVVTEADQERAKGLFVLADGIEKYMILPKDAPERAEYFAALAKILDQMTKEPEKGEVRGDSVFETVLPENFEKEKKLLSEISALWVNLEGNQEAVSKKAEDLKKLLQTEYPDSDKVSDEQAEEWKKASNEVASLLKLVEEVPSGDDAEVDDAAEPEVQETQEADGAEGLQKTDPTDEDTAEEAGDGEAVIETAVELEEEIALEEASTEEAITKADSEKEEDSESENPEADAADEEDLAGATTTGQTYSGERVSASQVIMIMESWLGKQKTADPAVDTHMDIVRIYNSYLPHPVGYVAKQSDDYCDITVSAAFILLQAADMLGGPECGVERHIQLFKKKGIWLEDGTITPQVGDLICYNWDYYGQPNNGTADHIGIVVAVNNKRITTIEGNMTAGRVSINTLNVGDGFIRGYARPKYLSEEEGKLSQQKKIEEFVTRLYSYCLGRKPDKGGLATWTNALLNEGQTASYVVNGFFNSKEMQEMGLSDSDFIETCYKVMMDRASDKSGKKTWLGVLQKGVTRNYVLQGFIGSEEFQNICLAHGVTRGSLTLTDPRDQSLTRTSATQDFVTRLYQVTLEREPDAGGLAGWVKYILSSGDPRTTAVNVAKDGFYHSREFLNKGLSDEDFVKSLYQTFLDRTYDNGGLKTWTKLLQNGTSRDTVIAGFANSTEFSNLLESYGF